MKLIPAYTIIEVTMALAISAITMTFMYKGKLFFEKLFLVHKRVEIEILETNLLDKSLRKDFFYSNDISWNEDVLQFAFKSDSLVNYSFKNQKTYKFYGARIDTFNVKCMVQDRILDNHISNLKMNMSMSNRSFLFMYTKQYTPYQILLQKNNLWN